jgi:pimeloyl-ACP methyl ester carboxylesterase
VTACAADAKRARAEASDHSLPATELEPGLPLLRFGGDATGRPAVLLLHGAGANSDTFLLPRGGIARYLTARGWDVWILDWRGSQRVLAELERAPLGGSIPAERRLFTLDHVAESDIPRALARIRSVIGERVSLGVLGFCAAGSALAMSVARGALERFGVERVTLVALGLFCETPWDGWMKAEDFILERVLAEEPTLRSVDPHALRWPAFLERAYELWPWLPDGTRPLQRLFRRLTFMYGEPYARARIHPSLSDATLLELFGPLHLGLYLHAGQLVRRGYAARFDEPDIVGRRLESAGTEHNLEGDLRSTHFKNKRVTLLTGAENQLWHRDSIDRMHDWLLAHACFRREPRHQKHVLRDYAHLDLFLGADAETEVYPLIAAAFD